MSLVARDWPMHTEDGLARQLVVACPQRIVPVSIRECASCELCAGLDLGSQVSVRCTVEPPNAGEGYGTPPAHASVQTVMTAPVVAVEVGASIENVRWLMLEGGVGAVPVIDAERRPVGILTKTDLLRERGDVSLSARPLAPDCSADAQSDAGLCAEDLMTPVVHAVGDRTSIAAAAALMAHARVHHVVVVSGSGELTGIVSSLDIAHWVAARERFCPRET